MSEPFETGGGGVFELEAIWLEPAALPLEVQVSESDDAETWVECASSRVLEPSGTARMQVTPTGAFCRVAARSIPGDTGCAFSLRIRRVPEEA